MCCCLCVLLVAPPHAPPPQHAVRAGGKVAAGPQAPCCCRQHPSPCCCSAAAAAASLARCIGAESAAAAAGPAASACGAPGFAALGARRVRLTPRRGSPLFSPSSSRQALQTGCREGAGHRGHTPASQTCPAARPQRLAARSNPRLSERHTSRTAANSRPGPPSTHLAGNVAAALAAARLRQRRRAGRVAQPRHPKLLCRADQVNDGAGAGGLQGSGSKPSFVKVKGRARALCRKEMGAQTASTPAAAQGRGKTTGGAVACWSRRCSRQAHWRVSQSGCQSGSSGVPHLQVFDKLASKAASRKGRVDALCRAAGEGGSGQHWQRRQRAGCLCLWSSAQSAALSM